MIELNSIQLNQTSGDVGEEENPLRMDSGGSGDSGVAGRVPFQPHFRIEMAGKVLQNPVNQLIQTITK